MCIRRSYRQHKDDGLKRPALRRGSSPILIHPLTLFHLPASPTHEYLFRSSPQPALAHRPAQAVRPAEHPITHAQDAKMLPRDVRELGVSSGWWEVQVQNRVARCRRCYFEVRAVAFGRLRILEGNRRWDLYHSPMNFGDGETRAKILRFWVRRVAEAREL